MVVPCNGGLLLRGGREKEGAYLQCEGSGRKGGGLHVRRGMEEEGEMGREKRGRNSPQ